MPFSNREIDAPCPSLYCWIQYLIRSCSNLSMKDQSRENPTANGESKITPPPIPLNMLSTVPCSLCVISFFGRYFRSDLVV